MKSVHKICLKSIYKKFRTTTIFLSIVSIHLAKRSFMPNLNVIWRCLQSQLSQTSSTKWYFNPITCMQYYRSFSVRQTRFIRCSLTRQDHQHSQPPLNESHFLLHNIRSKLIFINFTPHILQNDRAPRLICFETNRPRLVRLCIVANFPYLLRNLTHHRFYLYISVLDGSL